MRKFSEIKHSYNLAKMNYLKAVKSSLLNVPIDNSNNRKSQQHQQESKNGTRAPPPSPNSAISATDIDEDNDNNNNNLYGFHSPVVGKEQFEHWIKLHERVKHLDEHTKILNIGALSETQQANIDLLETIYNDALVWMDPARNAESSIQISLNHLGISEIVHPLLGSLCPVHGPHEAYDLQAPLMILSSFDVAEIPLEMTTEF